MYNSDDDTIYLSLSENGKIFLFPLNATDGSESTVYIANEFEIVFDAMLYNSQTLLI